MEHTSVSMVETKETPSLELAEGTNSTRGGDSGRGGKWKTGAEFLAAMMERVMGIEPTSSAWEAEVLPLNYTRITSRS